MEVSSGEWWYAVGDGCILKGMVVCHEVCRYEVGDGGMHFHTEAVQWGMVLYPGAWQYAVGDEGMRWDVASWHGALETCTYNSDLNS